MTKKEMFNAMVTIMSDAKVKNVVAEVTDITSDEFVAFAKHELELLEKKRSSKKPTKTQRENLELKEKIFEILKTEDRPMRVGEIALMLGIATQKVTPQLSALIDENRAEKKTEKKITYYSVTE